MEHTFGLMAMRWLHQWSSSKGNYNNLVEMSMGFILRKTHPSGSFGLPFFSEFPYIVCEPQSLKVPISAIYLESAQIEHSAILSLPP
jgi:hypothetical protein